MAYQTGNINTEEVLRASVNIESEKRKEPMPEKRVAPTLS